MTNEAMHELRDNVEVRLPLYDKITGVELPGYLAVDISVFTDGPRGLARRCRVVEFPDPTPDQAKEIMDRIVSGLPVEYLKPANPLGNYNYPKDVRTEQEEPIKLYDVASLYPQEVFVTDIVSAYPKLTNEQMANALKESAEMWERIPEFDNYEVNALGDIRSRWTKRTLEVAHQGGEKYVNMHDKDGYAHDINVRYVVEKVFGK